MRNNTSRHARLLPLATLVCAQFTGCYEVVGPDVVQDAAPVVHADASAVRCPVTPAAPLAIDHVRDLGVLSRPARMTGGGAMAVDTHLGPRWLFAEVGIAPTDADPRYRINVALATPTQGAPTQFTEALDAFDAPIEALPYRPEERAVSVPNPEGYLALWPNGLAVPVGDRTAIFVTRWRVRPGFLELTPDGVEGAWFSGDDRPIERVPGLIYRADEDPYTPVAVDGDVVYLQHCVIADFLNAQCTIARTIRSEVFERRAYVYWDGHLWTASPARAAVVASGMNGFTLSWNRHLARWVALYSEVLGNRIYMRTAAHPEGPYDAPVLVLEAPRPAVNNSYSATIHAPLSDPEGCTIVAGWYSPTSEIGGENRLVEVTLR